MMKVLTMDAKRQKVPGSVQGRLNIVATPIGNLGDLSVRAREVLASANWIACEDTRRTAQLFHALGMAHPPLRRFDQHTSEGQARAWAREIREGGLSVAVVSDAGTPGVSDPGALLVHEAYAAGVAVSPVPGPSSWAAILSISGWKDVKYWVFSGFFPRKKADRELEVREAQQAAVARPGASSAQVWLESPERIGDALAAFEGLCGIDAGRDNAQCPQAEFLLAKELTKVHERTFRGSWSEVSRELHAHLEAEGALGEWLFAVRFPRLDAVSGAGPTAPIEIDAVIESLLDAGTKTAEIARIMSHRFGVSRDDAYARAMRLKKIRGGG